jgi:hypothetical protein
MKRRPVLLKAVPPARPAGDELFPGRIGVSIGELAEAFSYSRDTIERAVTRGDLVAFGWPGSRRITVGSIRAFISRGVKSSPSGPSAKAHHPAERTPQ